MPLTICDNMVPFMFPYLKRFGRRYRTNKQTRSRTFTQIVVLRWTISILRLLDSPQKPFRTVILLQVSCILEKSATIISHLEYGMMLKHSYTPFAHFPEFLAKCTETYIKESGIEPHALAKVIKDAARSTTIQKWQPPLCLSCSAAQYNLIGFRGLELTFYGSQLKILL